jgi:hypothetical protein
MNVRELYGLDFPDDFFQLWELARDIRPSEPLRAFQQTLGVTLVGPFEVLAGRFEGRQPKLSLYLHWRFFMDPPEFFTVMMGDVDRLHWGYFWDDPSERPGWVASYYGADEGLDISAEGTTVFEALRRDLEQNVAQTAEYLAEDPAQADSYRAKLKELDELRARLSKRATADRPETGDGYLEKYDPAEARKKVISAATMDGMGIVVPKTAIRTLAIPEEKIREDLLSGADPGPLIQEAQKTLHFGFPGVALKIGRDLWAAGGEKYSMAAYELMDAAYDGLNRPLLQQVLRAHWQDRDLPSPDILDFNVEN